MCFKSILTKMLSLVKSIATNAETAACGSGTPTAACEEDQSDILSPALSWEEFWEFVLP